MPVTIVQVANGFIIEHGETTYVASTVWDIHNILKELYKEKNDE